MVGALTGEFECRSAAKGVMTAESNGNTLALSGEPVIVRSLVSSALFWSNPSRSPFHQSISSLRRPLSSGKNIDKRDLPVPGYSFSTSIKTYITLRSLSSLTFVRCMPLALGLRRAPATTIFCPMPKPPTSKRNQVFCLRLVTVMRRIIHSTERATHEICVIRKASGRSISLR